MCLNSCLLGKGEHPILAKAELAGPREGERQRQSAGSVFNLTSESRRPNLKKIIPSFLHFSPTGLREIYYCLMSEYQILIEIMFWIAVLWMAHYGIQITLHILELSVALNIILSK